MKYLFLWYPKCSTCQKAKKWLDDNNVLYEARDIKLQNPTMSELEKWHSLSGLPLKRFFNTSGLSYKALGLAAKLADMPQNEQLKLLGEDGMLVKRPLLAGGGKVLVGFKESEWSEIEH